jgi:type II secretory pathway pseudopilin PulG
MNVDAKLHIVNSSMAFRRNRRRRGAMTLIEVMVVGTLLTIVAGVAVTLLAAVFRLDQRVRDHGVRTEQALRLAESIRGDIRQGTNVSLPTADSLVVETADGGRVSYGLQPDGCRRVAQNGEGATSETDLFAIGTAATWTLDRRATGRRPLVVVELHRDTPAGGAGPPGLPLIIYGALGADRTPLEERP